MGTPFVRPWLLNEYSDAISCYFRLGLVRISLVRPFLSSAMKNIRVMEMRWREKHNNGMVGTKYFVMFPLHLLHIEYRYWQMQFCNSCLDTVMSRCTTSVLSFSITHNTPYHTFIIYWFLTLIFFPNSLSNKNWNGYLMRKFHVFSPWSCKFWR